MIFDSLLILYLVNMMLFVLYSDGGSDSSVSDGLPAHLQYIAQKVSDFIQAENYQLCLEMYSYLRTSEILTTTKWV